MAVHHYSRPSHKLAQIALGRALSWGLGHLLVTGCPPSPGFSWRKAFYLGPGDGSRVDLGKYPSGSTLIRASIIY